MDINPVFVRTWDPKKGTTLVNLNQIESIQDPDDGCGKLLLNSTRGKLYTIPQPAGPELDREPIDDLLKGHEIKVLNLFA